MLKELIYKSVRLARVIRRELLPNFASSNYPMLVRLHQILAGLSKQHYVRNVLGHDMFLDPNDSLGLSYNRIYERFETSLVQQFIKPGDAVLDLGANIGYYSLLFARLVGAEGRVFSFEPEPGNLELLRKNIALNGYTNVTVIDRAVSDTSQRVQLYYNEENRGDHRIFDPRDGAHAVPVESISLDDYFSDKSLPISYIKMDIQGAEHRALLGMTELLKRNPDIVLTTEFWPYGLAQSGVDAAAHFHLLETLGFTIQRFNEKDSTLEPASLRDLLNECTFENRHYENLFCRRGARAEWNIVI